MRKVDYLNKPRAVYRNKSLENLKGGQWASIPGLEDRYDVSNYGRIKSLAREIPYTNGKVIYKKERIIMAGISPAPNHFAKDFTYQLGAQLTAKPKNLRYSVARLVYHSFVQPIDLSDRSIYIIQKDGNGLNCYYKNLKAIQANEKQKRIYTNNRNISCFRRLDMKTIVQNDIERRQKPVSQYNKKGRRIKTFPSIKIASESTGVERSGISALLAGKHQTAGGYVWKRGKGDEKINLDGYFDAWKKTYKEKRGKKIVQYSLTGKKIKVFLSISDAASETGIPHSNISRAVNKHLKAAGGYKWKQLK